jgi:hypothetical protein
VAGGVTAALSSTISEFPSSSGTLWWLQRIWQVAPLARVVDRITACCDHAAVR